jgi:hypothetical protein
MKRHSLILLSLLPLSAAGCNLEPEPEPLAPVIAPLAPPDPRQVWFEAEDGARGGAMQAATSVGASRGRAILVPGNASEIGGVAFGFDLQQPRTLYPWARVRASSGNGSLYFSHDGALLKSWEPEVSTSTWRWERVHAPSQAPGLGISFAAGHHDLRFYATAGAPTIDRVLLTDDSYFEPVTDGFEAESAIQVVPPMTIGHTIGNPGTPPVGYFWVPNGPVQDGTALIPFLSTYDGQFALWGRSSAQSETQDCFDVNFNGGLASHWKLPYTSAHGWAWSRLPRLGDINSPFALDLTPAVGGLTFWGCDAGAKLDRIIVTNDPGFQPVDVAPPVLDDSTDPTP